MQMRPFLTVRSRITANDAPRCTENPCLLRHTLKPAARPVVLRPTLLRLRLQKREKACRCVPNGSVRSDRYGVKQRQGRPSASHWVRDRVAPALALLLRLGGTAGRRGAPRSLAREGVEASWWVGWRGVGAKRMPESTRMLHKNTKELSLVFAGMSLTCRNMN